VPHLVGLAIAHPDALAVGGGVIAERGKLTHRQMVDQTA
jgi:hypothetical protein